jgi:hypothetical protein
MSPGLQFGDERIHEYRFSQRGRHMWPVFGLTTWVFSLDRFRFHFLSSVPIAESGEVLVNQGLLDLHWQARTLNFGATLDERNVSVRQSRPGHDRQRRGIQVRDLNRHAADTGGQGGFQGGPWANHLAGIPFISDSGEVNSLEVGLGLLQKNKFRESDAALHNLTGRVDS